MVGANQLARRLLCSMRAVPAAWVSDWGCFCHRLVCHPAPLSLSHNRPVTHEQRGSSLLNILPLLLNTSILFWFLWQFRFLWRSYNELEHSPVAYYVHYAYTYLGLSVSFLLVELATSVWICHVAMEITERMCGNSDYSAQMCRHSCLASSLWHISLSLVVPTRVV